jgi:cytochrome c-type biogenesis protein CcmH
MLYAALAALAVATALALGWPLLRDRGRIADRRDFDVALYRAQLAELEAERRDGVIGDGEAAAARVEVERRLLRAADRAGAAGVRPLPVSGRRALALGVAGGVAALAALLYAATGNPGLPDRPATRAADVPAEQALPDELALRLASAMRARPDELRGWLMLGPLARSVGRYELAAEAWSNAARIEPGKVEHWLALGHAYVARDAGMVNPPARQAFARALELSPGEPMARYYLGLAAFQDHDDRAAYERWSALAADTPPDAAWAEMLQRGLDRVARRLGVAAPGPTAAQAEAAAAMSEDERAAMIEGMVEGLAARLRQSPGDLDGWLRLGRAYAVLGRAEQAAAAYGEALRLDPGNPQATAALAALKGG